MVRKLLKAPVCNDLAEPRSQQKGTVIPQNTQSFEGRNRTLRENRDSCLSGSQVRPLTAEVALVFEVVSVREGGIFSGLPEKIKSCVLKSYESTVGVSLGLRDFTHRVGWEQGQERPPGAPCARGETGKGFIAWLLTLVCLCPAPVL